MTSQNLMVIALSRLTDGTERVCGFAKRKPATASLETHPTRWESPAGGPIV
jgi:hypothetical protein